MPEPIKNEKIEEESKKEKPKEERVAVLHRAVPIEDMFNHISDKIDILSAQLQELIKIAKEE